MKIHKRLHEEGTKAILVTLAFIVAITVAVNWFWPSQTVWHYLLYAFLTVVFVLTVRFFRVRSQGRGACGFPARASMLC